MSVFSPTYTDNHLNQPKLPLFRPDGNHSLRAGARLTTQNASPSSHRLSQTVPNIHIDFVLTFPKVLWLNF
jgi:hypothetical protein